MRQALLALLALLLIAGPAYPDEKGAATPMWQTEIEWWQFPIRAVVVYAFLIVLLRITGKRQIGQLAPFDLVLLLILSNAVQNSMNGGDNSITGGLILASTLVILNGLVAVATYRSKWIESLIEGRPVLLIHNGQVDHKALASVRMTMHELHASLRSNGCAALEEVHIAILENNGTVTVVRMGDAQNSNHAIKPIVPGEPR